MANDINNYYESEYYKITILESKYNDIFLLYLEDNIKELTVKLINKINSGWNYNLKLILRNKLLCKDFIINIGSCQESIKKINIEAEKLDIEGKEKTHFENDEYKIFYISILYNDIFKINYDEERKIINIIRIDINSDWGQDLILKYVKKHDPKKIKYIHIGKSKVNNLMLNLDISQIPYEHVYNYYESESYTLTLYQNAFPDNFLLKISENNLFTYIYIKRLDKNCGWGQELKLNIVNKITNQNFIIYIGPSKINEFYRKINLTSRKCFAALTTIPSRIIEPIFMENLLNFIECQTHPFENIFITIAQNYKRFKDHIPPGIIQKLQTIPKVILIIIENDYGPASKYLGPLLNYYNILKDNLLVIIDDDRKYNKNLIRNFLIGSQSFPNITYSSGLWKSYFDKDYKNLNDELLEMNLFKENRNDNSFPIGCSLGGFFGFCIKVDRLEDFIQYNLKILERIDKAYLHDEGIILGFLKSREEEILYLKHRGCNIIEKELSNALCESNVINRKKMEKQILMTTILEGL
jgi:hypothetical protein